METRNYEITEEEYNSLQRALKGVECIQNWGEMIGNIAVGLKARAAMQDPDCFDAATFSDEAWREQNLFELLSVLQSIHEKNNGFLELPSFPPAGPQLSRKEEITFKANAIISKRLNLNMEKLQQMSRHLMDMHNAVVYGEKEVSQEEREAYEQTFIALNSTIKANIIMRRNRGITD